MIFPVLLQLQDWMQLQYYTYSELNRITLYFLPPCFTSLSKEGMGELLHETERVCDLGSQTLNADAGPTVCLHKAVAAVLSGIGFHCLNKVNKDFQ